MDAETRRLREDERREQNWKRWGPYLSERQWGTVREDYSANGDAWGYFGHEHAAARTYRWGEDGLLGICDRQSRLCFALALWNGRDPILKERLFGLTGPQGNHGEDVKELYFYLDSTPTHSYMRSLYKYPQAEFPYAALVDENAARSREQPEFELADTGVFDDGRYFDVFAEYAKAAPDDVLVRIRLVNRGPDPAVLHLLPTLWFRNTWSWKREGEGYWPKPRLSQAGDHAVLAEHRSFGPFRLLFDPDGEAGAPQLVFTDNETNVETVFGAPSTTPYVKDAFHAYVVGDKREAVNPERTGTKCAAIYRVELPPGGEATIRARLVADTDRPQVAFDEGFDRTMAERADECRAFYEPQTGGLATEQANVTRQAYAGLLFSKQFYRFTVKDWLDGDPASPPPPAERRAIRNHDWPHLYNRDLILMPDKWEYPWYAVWDLAFHTIPLADLDPQFAKEQLVLFLREWYMHANGQLPAYEWEFSNVNPPVHAWAAWRIYKMTGARGKRDRLFLSRVFQKLLLNFTWWVNRKDLEGKHLFAGGFLGLDNIGVFDRSGPMPVAGRLEQADGTAWMAFFCSTMLSIALKLSEDNPATEDMASKFFEHFVAIVDAINSLDGTGLWDEEDGFYYDHLHVDGKSVPLKVRSMVGIIPLFAVEVLEERKIQKLHGFSKRMQWFLENRGDLARHISYMERGTGGLRLLALTNRERLERVLRYVLDENEFLSPYGVRSLSRFHQDHPFVQEVDGQRHEVRYERGESQSAMFGGNSNWRGPVWFPLNFLLIESLERYHHFYGDDLRVECPTGSGQMMNLREVAGEIATRLSRLFLPGENGQRPCHGGDPRFASDPHWKDLLLFHEFFDGEDGRGLGASHQTGWTALIARLLQKGDVSQ